MTRTLQEMLGLLRSRAATLSRRARWGLVLVGVVGVCGALALALSPRRGEMVPLKTPAVEAADLDAAREMLADCGIASKVVSGRLVVPRARLAEAREVLSPLGQERQDAIEAMHALAKEDDIWRTGAQNEQRWHAAKMIALSRLIETFPSVARATVLYEPGTPRGLGGGQEPTAAVKVTMRPGATLTRSVAGAIADLVAGSIAGLGSHNVRVVDGSGRSYRFDPASEQADQQLQQRRATETYYHEKIHTALAYIDKVVIGVSLVDADGRSDEGLTVSVAVPRSYLASAAVGRTDPSAAAETLAAIRQSVVAVTPNRPCHVTADWYYDAETAPARAAIIARRGAGVGWMTTLAVAGVCAGGGVGIGWLGRRYLPHRGPDRASGKDAAARTAGAETAAESGQPPQSRPWDFLQGLTSDETLSLVATEHPQTIAIVLGQLPAAKAAAVLAGLSEETQAAVGRRIAVLHQVDPVVIIEVGRSLAERVAELVQAGPEAAGAEGRVAEILRHAGYATEKAVLSALAGQAPSLAEAVRRRLFRFEDIAQLPPERLRAALAEVETIELAVALRTAGEDVKSKVFSAMPAAVARRVRQEMDRMVPVRLTEVEAAQQRVAEAVRRVESGQYLSQSPERERQLLA
ncbi:MAG: hypothetical protein MUP47_01520 [Phycisphaerae bacterium]|nr:hypothetical protein [Phycisphaerae bacterium]